MYKGWAVVIMVMQPYPSLIHSEYPYWVTKYEYLSRIILLSNLITIAEIRTQPAANTQPPAASDRYFFPSPVFSALFCQFSLKMSWNGLSSIFIIYVYFEQYNPPRCAIHSHTISPSTAKSDYLTLQRASAAILIIYNRYNSSCCWLVYTCIPPVQLRDVLALGLVSFSLLLASQRRHSHSFFSSFLVLLAALAVQSCVVLC